MGNIQYGFATHLIPRIGLEMEPIQQKSPFARSIWESAVSYYLDQLGQRWPQIGGPYPLSDYDWQIYQDLEPSVAAVAILVDRTLNGLGNRISFMEQAVSAMAQRLEVMTAMMQKMPGEPVQVPEGIALEFLPAPDRKKMN